MQSQHMIHQETNKNTIKDDIYRIRLKYQTQTLFNMLREKVNRPDSGGRYGIYSNVTLKWNYNFESYLKHVY